MLYNHKCRRRNFVGFMAIYKAKMSAANDFLGFMAVYKAKMSATGENFGNQWPFVGGKLGKFCGLGRTFFKVSKLFF